ncbi:MAG: NADH-quinone oxidoreductase subunit J [Pseudomonadota bacterium]|jgi:NADH-quinone oxidoreductase subunit J
MTTELALFYAFAAVTVGAALGVVTVKNTVHAALLLVLTFFSCACLWLLLRAEFLAIVLVLVYVGAVMVLFLFVVMMLDIRTDTLREGFARYLPVAGAVAGIMLAQMLALIGWNAALQLPAPDVDGAMMAGTSNTEWIGRALFTEYILPFEVAAVILTVAIIAAIALTLRHRPGVRRQDPSRQVQVRKEDRLRVVKMPAEGGEGER